MSDSVERDCFETVAIVYSQPETTLMLSMFAFYGIPAYARGFSHARACRPFVIALGGMVVRVRGDAVDEALEFLAEIAQRPAAVRPKLINNPVLNFLVGFLSTSLVISPPTRTASTFFLRRQ